MALSYLLAITDKPTLTAAFVKRISDNLPAGWTSEDDKQGGVAYAVLVSIAGSMADIVIEQQYVRNSTRFNTATSPELDEDATDYFGISLPRANGEADATYAARITANIFRQAVTRPAIYNSLSAAVGTNATVRMIEPFYIADVGTYGNAYYDNDSAAGPGRWCNPVGGVGLIEITRHSASYTVPSTIAGIVEAMRAEGVLIGIRVI